MGEELKPGDTVQLKSGGPVMTIRGRGNGKWICDWFDDRKNKSGEFASEQLRKVEESPGAPFA